ncbi:unnamed protein product [Closterium sp. NIES-64]|nr:unnamed protein product [Closterium sp. NIES-64]
MPPYPCTMACSLHSLTVSLTTLPVGPCPPGCWRATAFRAPSQTAWANSLPCATCETCTRYLSSNSFYGPIPDCLFSAFPCLNRLDVSHNSFYGRINRNFEGIVPTAGALLNLAHNFFYGDPVLFASGCQFCPSEIAGESVVEPGELSVQAGGNCVVQSEAGRFSQRTPAACRAFCSITDNGPCDGHGACVPPPQGGDSSHGSTANFSCQCDVGYSAFDSGNGSTCVILTTTTVPGPGLSPAAVAGIALGCFFGLALLAATLMWFLLPKRRRKWGDLDVCHEFSLQQLMQATDNWADANRLGRGGFATVYLGVSPQGEMWAVKRCRVMTNDFEKEVAKRETGAAAGDMRLLFLLAYSAVHAQVRAMATLRHENLVRLLGFCVDMQVESGRQEQVLVYEYVGNGDLKHHIHHAKCPLTFHQRLKIALGAAEGLSYLHSFSTPIVHRDVKPANILVTDSLAAKLADFGLLKQLTEGDGEGGATRIAGTPGYVDPDYNRTRVVSPKTDVYSFGVVLLEMLTGRPAVMSEEDYHIATWAAQRGADYELDLLKHPSMEAAQRVAEYELDLLKDPSMEVPEDAIVDFADIALDCLKMPCTRRPDMKAVVHRIDDMIQKYCTGKGEWVAAPAEPVMRELVSEDVDSVGMEGFGGVCGFTSTESTDQSGVVSGQESGSLLGKRVVEGRDSEEAVGLRNSATDSMTSKGSHAEHSAIENRVHPR